MGRSIIITSGKGGVGKTTVTANLGLVLAARGRSTVLVDGDIGLNNLDVTVGAEEKIIYDIGDLIMGKAVLEQCLVKVASDLFLLPSMTACSAFVSKESFATVCGELAENFDYVLIDSPAGLELNFNRAVGGAKEGILVTTPHISGVRDAYKAGKILTSLNFGTGLIVNRIRGDLVVDEKILSAEQIAGAIKIPLYGVLPEDEDVNLFGLIDPENRRSASSYSYNLIADYVEGKDKKIYDYRRPYKGFFGRLARKAR